MSRVALLGTGLMGTAMARRLLAAGHAVTVYNRTPDKARALAAAGAAIAKTPATAVVDAEIVIAMVGDDAASRAMWLGPHGALAGEPAGAVIAIESSTLSHAWVLELAAVVAAAGWRFLDCPVTGGPDGAGRGALTLLVGGAAETLAAARPVLDAYASSAVLFGDAGAGTAYKLVVNLVATAQIAGAAEGLLMAEKAGLDLALVARMFAAGSVGSPVVNYVSDRVVRGDHDDVYFATRWRAKDANYGLALAGRLGQATPTCTAAGALFERAMAAGDGDRNSSVVVDLLRRLTTGDDPRTDADPTR